NTLFSTYNLLTPQTFTLFPYTTLFRSHDANAFFNENRNSVDNKMRIGFKEFLTCLNSYLDLFDFAIDLTGETRVHIYGSVTLERSEEHTSELQSLRHLVCRLLLEKKKQ